MFLRNNLTYKSCAGHRTASIALVVLSLLLSFCVMGGSLALMGLKRGLSSLDARLGADVMVVPYKAATQNYLEDAILMGNQGYYYMPASKISEISEKIDGIENISPQLYLATTTSSCCSYKVSVVGFDPASDFTITPWVQRTYDGTMSDYQVFVGCDLNAYAGDTIKFFDVPLTVAARLDRTGTYLDRAVYTNMNTARALVQSAENLHLFSSVNSGIDPSTTISSVLIKLKDGYSAAAAQGEIKTYINQVAAVKTETSVEDVSNKLSGIENIALIGIIAIWALLFVIELIAFNMNFNSRMKEFAILRVIGASKKKLSSLLMNEAFTLGLLGSAIGTAVSLMFMILISGQIESSLDMPFLLPSGGRVLIIFVCSVAAGIAASALAAFISSRRAGNIDAALILRGEG